MRCAISVSVSHASLAAAAAAGCVRDCYDAAAVSSTADRRRDGRQLARTTFQNSISNAAAAVAERRVYRGGAECNFPRYSISECVFFD